MSRLSPETNAVAVAIPEDVSKIHDPHRVPLSSTILENRTKSTDAPCR
jgi:hypothetical protein